MASYTIKKGDTLTAIAKKYGTTVNAIAKANSISNVNKIYANKKLTIPASNKSTTAKKTTTAKKAASTTVKKPATTAVKKPTASQTYTNEYTSAVDKLLANTGGKDYDYEKVKTSNVPKPSLKTAKELAQLYGLDYNYDNIYNTLMNSVNKSYDTRYAEQGNAEGKYYDQAATAQSTLMDTIRQQQSQAVQQGTNKGMQAANALSSMLGVSQQFAGNATSLAEQRALIAKEQQASIAKTGESALNAYNTMGQQLGDISKNLYSSDTSSYAAGLDYNASANTANASMAASAMQAQAQVQATLTNSLADIQNSFHSGQISKETANIASNAQIQSAKQYGVDAATINSAATRAAAQTTANAYKQYSGGSSGGSGGTPVESTKGSTVPKVNVREMLMNNWKTGALKADDVQSTVNYYLNNGQLTSEDAYDLKAGLRTTGTPSNTQPMVNSVDNLLRNNPWSANLLKSTLNTAKPTVPKPALGLDLNYGRYKK